MVGVVMMVMVSCGDGGGGVDDAGDRGGGGGEDAAPTSSTTEAPTTTGSPPTTAPPTTIATGPIGETVGNGGWAVLVHRVIDPYGPAGNASGDRTILVDVEVTHTGQGGTTSLTAFENFRLTGGDVSASGVDVQGMPSIAGPLAGGASRRGTMGFLVGVEVTTGMQLLFRPSLLDDPVVAVQIS